MKSTFYAIVLDGSLLYDARAKKFTTIDTHASRWSIDNYSEADRILRDICDNPRYDDRVEIVKFDVNVPEGN